MASPVRHSAFSAYHFYKFLECFCCATLVGNAFSPTIPAHIIDVEHYPFIVPVAGWFHFTKEVRREQHEGRWCFEFIIALLCMSFLSRFKLNAIYALH
jgi:hypothetical protein